MLRFPFATAVDRFFGVSTSLRSPRKRRSRAGVRVGVEPLEGRALLATVNVGIQDFSFSPATVTIHVGDTIHWTWNDSDHSTTSVAHIAETWSSGVLNAGATFNHTFSHVGSFQYYCVIHGQDNGNGTASGMAGTIVVMPATAISLTSISVTPANSTLGLGATQAYTATGTFSDNSTENITSQVTWASSNPSVATITSAGLATGVTAGTSTITASMSGITGSTGLTVSTSASPTPTPSPTQPAPTLVSEMRMFVGKGAKRKLIGFNLVFSTPLDITVAQDVTHYHITQPGATKKAHPVNVPVKMAMYNPSTDTVMLMQGKYNKAKPLTLTATGLVGFSGTPAATIVTKL
jgi:plastocyanin